MLLLIMVITFSHADQSGNRLCFYLIQLNEEQIGNFLLIAADAILWEFTFNHL
jgi:hypothetical protein